MTEEEEKAQALEFAQNIAMKTESFSVNDYIQWFEKINLNTFIWQIIAIIVILSFRKEIKSFLQGLIDKIPQLKSLGVAEFEISNETKIALEESSDRLQKEIEAYEVVADKNPNIVFLTIFIDIESKLTEICTNYYINDDLAWLRASTYERIENLIRNNVIDRKAMPLFQDVRGLRNRIAHGEKPLKNMPEARPYFEALLLLKDIIAEGLEKVLQNKEINKKAAKL